MIIDVDDATTRELADSLFYPLRQIYDHRQNQPGNYLAPRARAVGNQNCLRRYYRMKDLRSNTRISMTHVAAHGVY